MFNPALGTFINLDPLESGSNFYAYCGDAPTDGTDPSGFAQSPPVQGHTADLTQATNPSALESNQAVLFLGHFVPTDLTDDNREEAGPIQGADEIEHVVRKMKLKTPNTPGGSHISVVGCFQPSAERLVKKLFGNEVWLTDSAYSRERHENVWRAGLANRRPGLPNGEECSLQYTRLLRPSIY